MFLLASNHIKRLAEINYFQIPGDKMFFFGLRGCLPFSDNSTQFKSEHQVEITPYDHIHPRCTLGQFQPEKGISLFPGSTVPFLLNIKQSLENRGIGSNMLLTGYYKHYYKGWHKWGSETAHRAFRQDNELPVRRTNDDLDYDNDDLVDCNHPYDNLHAAWSMGPNHDFFSSAGCQVVVGYPQCKKRNNLPDTGPWKIFKENAYANEQQEFDYMLLTGRDAEKVALTQEQTLPVRLRYGSQGSLVGELQQKLLSLNYYHGRIDKFFSLSTLKALLAFQEDHFGKDADDGVVGPITASALNIHWPSL